MTPVTIIPAVANLRRIDTARDDQTRALRSTPLAQIAVRIVCDFSLRCSAARSPNSPASTATRECTHREVDNFGVRYVKFVLIKFMLRSQRGKTSRRHGLIAGARDTREASSRNITKRLRWHLLSSRLNRYQAISQVTRAAIKD